jgi:2'-5' RNA ligase
MRCFLAIELPDPVKRRLAVLQQQLQELDRLVRWTRPEQIHLTLNFLGEVAEQQVPRLCDASKTIAAGVAPFDIEIAGIGCFPSGGPPRVIWAGVTGPPPALSTCQRRCEQAFAELGIPPEDRPYRPHLTLARTREHVNARPIRPALEQFKTSNAGRFQPTELILFQSILGSSGATHVPLVRAPLRHQTSG